MLVKVVTLPNVHVPGSVVVVVVVVVVAVVGLYCRL